MQFLSDEWLAALDVAARHRAIPEDDPLQGVRVTIEQVVREGPRWRLHVDDGSMWVEAHPRGGEADIRLTGDRATVTAIAAGRRAALDAFISGDLVIGGDVRALLDHREALEALGDLFGEVRAATSFPADR